VAFYCSADQKAGLSSIKKHFRISPYDTHVADKYRASNPRARADADVQARF